jgi:hypothetical protein
MTGICNEPQLNEISKDRDMACLCPSIFHLNFAHCTSFTFDILPIDSIVHCISLSFDISLEFGSLDMLVL